MTAPETVPAPLPVWIVVEKKHQRWECRVYASTAAEALRFARSCGFWEPATVTREEA